MISPIGIFGLAALLTQATTVSAAAVRGSVASDNGAVAPGSPSDGGRYLLTEERRLLPHEGVMRTLIIRVTDSEGEVPPRGGRNVQISLRPHEY